MLQLKYETESTVIQFKRRMTEKRIGGGLAQHMSKRDFRTKLNEPKAELLNEKSIKSMPNSVEKSHYHISLFHISNILGAVY